MVLGIHSDLKLFVFLGILIAVFSLPIMVVVIVTLLGSIYRIVADRSFDLNILANMLMAVVVGGGFAWAAYIFGVKKLRWYRRATWVYENIAPVEMEIAIRSGRGSFYVEMLPKKKGQPLPQQSNKVDIITPLKFIRDLKIDTPLRAKVYFDSETNGPIVFGIPAGIIWPK
jgi:hypothetical protein